MVSENFKTERISRSSIIQLEGDIDTVFPLFTPFEERKWVEGWDPRLVYPHKEIVEEGTSFRTRGRYPGEDEYLWIINKYEPDIFRVEYLVSTPDRFWTIAVACNPKSKNQSTAEITYTFTGLNPDGNRLNQLALEEMYHDSLKDWEAAINRYLENT